MYTPRTIITQNSLNIKISYRIYVQAQTEKKVYEKKQLEVNTTVSVTAAYVICIVQRYITNSASVHSI